MRLSIWPNAQQPLADIVEVTTHAERTGWSAVYVADHFMGDGSSFGEPDTPTFESTALLGALAACTERMELATLVLGNTYRHPAVVANWAATMDHVSGGRMVLGVGAGWQRNEHEQYGIELPAPGERVTRFGEACQVLTGLLRDPITDVDGEHYRLSGAVCRPEPVQERLPLLIGAKGDRMLGLVATYADRWNLWGLPEAIAERSAVLERHCERIGRDPSEIRRSTQALVMLTDDAERARRFVDSVAPRAAVAGPAEHFAKTVERWSDVGIDEVIVPDQTLGSGPARLERLEQLRASVPA